MLYLGDAQVNIKLGAKKNEDGTTSSNDILVDASRFYTPKEYEIYFIVSDKPYKLDYNIKDIDKCLIRRDTEGNSNYVILDGKLFQILDARKGMAGLTQVGTSDKWTDITGLSSGTSVRDGIYYALGVCDGQLYSILNTKATRINTEKGWHGLSGYMYIDTYSSSWGYDKTDTMAAAHAMLNDSLYRCSISSEGKFSVSLQGSAGTFKGAIGTYLQNVLSSSSTDRFAIKYAKDGTFSSEYTIGKLANVVKFVGNTSHNNDPTTFYGYALTNSGGLYRLSHSSIGQISTIKTGWTDVSGFSSSGSHWGLGINNGKLYHLYGSTITQIGTDTNWTSVSGHFTASRKAFGICGKKVYSIVNKTTLVDCGVKNPIKVIANGNGATSPTFVICRA
jgi:hypothetical protein